MCYSVAFCRVSGLPNPVPARPSSRLWRDGSAQWVNSRINELPTPMGMNEVCLKSHYRDPALLYARVKQLVCSQMIYLKCVSLNWLRHKNSWLRPGIQFISVQFTGGLKLKREGGSRPNKTDTRVKRKKLMNFVCIYPEMNFFRYLWATTRINRDVFFETPTNTRAKLQWIQKPPWRSEN